MRPAAALDPVEGRVECGDEERLPEAPPRRLALPVAAQPGGEGLRSSSPRCRRRAASSARGDLQPCAMARARKRRKGRARCSGAGRRSARSRARPGCGEHAPRRSAAGGGGLPHPQLLDELEEARVAAEDGVLAAVDLECRRAGTRWSCRRAAGCAPAGSTRQPCRFSSSAAARPARPAPTTATWRRSASHARGTAVGTPTAACAAGAGSPARCARAREEPARRDAIPPRRRAHRPARAAAAQERTITSAFSPEESRTRCRSGSSGSASMRSRIPL